MAAQNPRQQKLTALASFLTCLDLLLEGDLLDCLIQAQAHCKVS